MESYADNWPIHSTWIAEPNRLFYSILLGYIITGLLIWRTVYEDTKSILFGGNLEIMVYMFFIEKRLCLLYIS